MYINFNNQFSSPKISFHGFVQKPKVTPKQIIELLDAGKKPTEIAETLGMSFGIVYKWMRKYNILSPLKVLHKNIEDAALPLILEGHSQKYISKTTGIKGVDIKKMCDRLGLNLQEIRKKKFAEMIIQGCTNAQIAEKLNLKEDSISQMIRRSKLSKIKKAAKKEMRKKQMIKLLQDGYTNAQIAKKLNLSVDIVNHNISYHKLGKYRKTNPTKIELEKLNKEKYQNKLDKTILKMLSQGKTVSEIAKKVNKTKFAIYRYLKAHNFPSPLEFRQNKEKPLFEIVKTMALEGEPINKIMKQTGLYRNKIVAFLESNEIDIKAIQHQKNLEKLQ